MSSQKDTVSQTTDHSPDINFLSYTIAGMNKAVNFQSGAQPLLVKLEWKASNQYPCILMVFRFGGQKFSMIVYTAHYGTWNGPGPCPAGFILEVPFESNAMTMDLPEAWQRVKDAGWDEPLGGLNVVYAKEEAAFKPDIWYRFCDAIYSSGASVTVSPKVVKMF